MVSQELQRCSTQRKECLSARVSIVIDIMMLRTAQMVTCVENVGLALYANILDVLDIPKCLLMAADRQVLWV